ncbi:MAG: hypothetical protein IJJ47_06585 [Methanosphaera sp.]|nr:hypothetical protein [Methanosphaera sp.]
MLWDEYFDEDRLNRGYDYYIKDKVFDIILTDDYVTAKVEGSKQNIYEVKITFKDEKIDSLYCTCPYCYADFNCKHMVATLYKRDEILKNKEYDISDENYNKILIFEDILKKIDETTLKKFIYDSLKDNEDFVEKFINEFQTEFSPEDFDNYENMLENIFNIDIVELYNENGFYEESPFHKYLLNFINNKISLLYKNREYDYVLQLLYIIYDNIGQKKNVKQYIDTDEILRTCNYYIEQVIDHQDKMENDEVFNYLITKINYDYNPETSNYLIDICLKKFNTLKYNKELEKVIDYLVENYENEDLIIYKFKIMQRLNYDSHQKENFLKENKKYKNVMKLMISQKINQNDYNVAIELLEENKSIHGNTDSLDDTLLLFNLYKIINDKNNVKKELKEIIYEFNIKDMMYINELKELCTANEWNRETNNLINFYNESYEYEFLNILYINEKRYEDLFINVTKNCNVESIEKYRKYYEESHSKEILDFYQNLILESSKTAKHKGAYNVIINYLNTMLTYTDSVNQVESLIKVLKNKYKNKSLFIKKLNEVQEKIDNK